MFARKHQGADVPRLSLGRILERLVQRGYARDDLLRGRSDQRDGGSGEAGAIFEPTHPSNAKSVDYHLPHQEFDN